MTKTEALDWLDMAYLDLVLWEWKNNEVLTKKEIHKMKKLLARINKRLNEANGRS